MRILLVNDYERAATGGDIHVYLVKKLLEERGHVVQRFTCGCTPGSVYSQDATLKESFSMTG